ncbi:MAG: hypothetical protein DRO18_06640, partial [Thermoprotei archaeon]
MKIGPCCSIPAEKLCPQLLLWVEILGFISDMVAGEASGGVAELNKVKGVILNERKNELLRRFEYYLIARNRRSVDRYLRIASEFLEPCGQEE